MILLSITMTLSRNLYQYFCELGGGTGPERCVDAGGSAALAGEAS